MVLETELIGGITLFVEDLKTSLAFYKDKLGLEEVLDPESSTTLKLGSSYLRLVESEKDKDLKAQNPAYGSADIAITSSLNTNEIVELLGMAGILLLKGPVDVVVGGKAYQSVFLRDPDKNLVEIRTSNTVDLNRFDKHPEDHTFEQNM